MREGITVSAATISRILTRHGAVVADPGKRPKSSYRRFQAEVPNELWQSDFTHWQLADGTDVEILNWLDDHSPYLLGATCHRPVTGPIVVAAFRAVVAAHGIPAAVLTDNGLVYTTRFAGGRRGTATRNGFETELARLGVQQKNSSPNHPQTCGKAERFHQTLKNWLAAQPRARTRPNSRPNSMPSAASTTSGDPIAPSAGAPRRSPTPPAPQGHLHRHLADA